MIAGLFERAETGKLIVSSIAVFVDPTGIAATTLGLDAVIEVRNRMFKGKSDLDALAKELSQGFDKKLEALTKPTDAQQVLPQMLEQALKYPEGFVKHDLDADAIVNALVQRFKDSKNADPEHKRDDMIAAFKNLYGPLLYLACNDPRLKAALDPALYRDQRKEQREMKGMLEALLAGQYVPIGDLKLLAAEFGEHEIEDQNSLEHFLKLKAEEYMALKSEVDSIGETYQRLSNLKAAAQDAIAKVNLEEVEDLLEKVQAIELDEAAKTAELRAQNALLRGNTDQAYRLLSAAADSFGAVDNLEPTRRRLRYEDILYSHGLRFGGNGMALSERMVRTATHDDVKHRAPLLWAEGKNALAIALRNQGSHTAGPEGGDLLGQAVNAYRDALRVFTEAVHPVYWAGTMQNLGGALRSQGSRTQGPEGADLLRQAVSAYRDALCVTTEADHPVDWAMTMQNLGDALADQGIRTAGPAGADLLNQAVFAYRDALRVRTEADHPVDWAMTQENLASAEVARAAHDTTADPRPHQEAALTHIDAALRVYDPEHMSYDYETATRLRDHIQAALDAL